MPLIEVTIAQGVPPETAGAHQQAHRGGGRDRMSRVKQLQDLGSGSWDARVGQTDVDVVRAVPGDGLVRADRVVVDAVALRVLDQIQHVVDLRQRPLSEPSGFGQGELTAVMAGAGSPSARRASPGRTSTSNPDRRPAQTLRWPRDVRARAAALSLDLVASWAWPRTSRSPPSARSGLMAAPGPLGHADHQAEQNLVVGTPPRGGMTNGAGGGVLDPRRPATVTSAGDALR